MMHARTIHACLLLGLLAPTLPSCRSREPAPFETFTRNKLAAVVRGLESARDAQVLARDQLVKTLDAIRRDAWTGAVPDDAYDLIRRMRSTCESRSTSAHQRIRQASLRGDEYFGQWSRELEDYDDTDLRASGRRARNDLKARFDETIRALKAAEATIEPVLTVIDDQVLFIKHHRGQQALPERPTPTIDPPAQADALINLTRLAELQVDDFFDGVSIEK